MEAEEVDPPGARPSDDTSSRSHLHCTHCLAILVDCRLCQGRPARDLDVPASRPSPPPAATRLTRPQFLPSADPLPVPLTSVPPILRVV